MLAAGRIPETPGLGGEASGRLGVWEGGAGGIQSPQGLGAQKGGPAAGQGQPVHAGPGVGREDGRGGWQRSSPSPSRQRPGFRPQPTRGAARAWDGTPASVLALPSPAWDPAGDTGSRPPRPHLERGGGSSWQGYSGAHGPGWPGRRGTSRPGEMGPHPHTETLSSRFSFSESVPSRTGPRSRRSWDGEWTPVP